MSEGNEEQKRFQLHLSTGVVLMVVAALVLGIHIMFARLSPHVKWDGATKTIYRYSAGWPMAEQKEFFEYSTRGEVISSGSTKIAALPVNIFASLLILALTVFLCEYLIRRRKRTQAAQP